MNWTGLSSRVKWTLVMMLVAVVPTLAGITIGIVVFGEAVPPFVYIIPAIWVILFLVSMVRIRIGLIGGCVWAVGNVFAPVILWLQGIQSAIGAAVGSPVCPFSILSSVISIGIIYLCITAYREVSAGTA